MGPSWFLPFEVFVNNTNPTFLYEISIEVSSEIKLPLVGIELTIDHHWFTSLMPEMSDFCYLRKPRLIQYIENNCW